MKHRTLAVALTAIIWLGTSCSSAGSPLADEQDEVIENTSDGEATTSVAESAPALEEPPPDTSPGVLIDATRDYGIDEELMGIRGHAVATADVNNDGWADLFVGTFADRPIETYGSAGPAPDRLLLGSASGFEVDPTFEGRLGRSAGALFADLDGDGDQDLIVSRNVRDKPRGDAPSEVYRNEDGRLVSASVLDDERGGRAPAVIDYDGDGVLEILLVEDRWSGGSTAIFANEGNMTFRDVTASAGLPLDIFGLGVAVADLDDDGFDDFVVGGSNRWFFGTGVGFVEASRSPLPWELEGDEDDPAHVTIIDLDLDGRLDVIIGQHFNSTIDRGVPQPVRLFMNRDDGDRVELVDATDAAGLPGLTTKSPRVLTLDLDGDGWQDLVMTASIDESSGLSPFVLASGGAGSGQFAEVDQRVGPHYWIDAVLLDVNNDGRQDVFFLEWEPSIGSRLFLNVSVEDQ